MDADALLEGLDPSQREAVTTETLKLQRSVRQLTVARDIVPNINRLVRATRAAGGVITREAGPVKGGSTIIAFVQDPDGYKVELIQNGTHG